MDPTTIMLIALSIITGSIIFSPENIERQKQQKIPVIQSTQQFTIDWWRTIDKKQLDINQYHYLPNLELMPGLRHVLVPYSSGRIKAFRLRDGEWEWTLDTQEHITSGIEANNRSFYAYVGGRDGTITQFSNLSGKMGWQVKMGNTVTALKIHRKILFSYGINGELSAIDIPTGKIRWSVKHEQPLSSIYGTAKPVIADDLVLMGSADGQLNAYSIDKGERRWTIILGHSRGFSEIDSLVDVDSTSVFLKDRIISSAFGGSIKAFSTKSGKELWQYSASTIDPIIAFKGNPKKAIIQTDDDKIIALNTQNGEVLWENKQLILRNLTRLTPVSKEGRELLLVTDKLAHVFILDAHNGKLVYHYPAEYPLAMSPSIHRKNIYMLNQNGELLSYRLTAKP